MNISRHTNIVIGMPSLSTVLPFNALYRLGRVTIISPHLDARVPTRPGATTPRTGILPTPRTATTTSPRHFDYVSTGQLLGYFR
jgi:hypothetical protein